VALCSGLGALHRDDHRDFFVNWSSIVYKASQDLLEHYLHLLFYFHKVYFFMPSLLFDKPV